MRVVDGDTITVVPTDGLEATGTHDGTAEHTVRLLGIDAAEMNYHSGSDPDCGAQEATDHLDELLPEGTEVTITFDPRSDHTDYYGRSLAYVGTDEVTDVGAAQVADGFAMPWYPEDEPEPERVATYRMAADTATDQGLGAHATCETIGRG